MKKKYQKPSFNPVVLEANVLAEEACKFSCSWSWEICKVVIDSEIIVFSDEAHGCNTLPGTGVNICDHDPTPNSNLFGS